MMQYVEVWDLLGSAQEAYYIRKQLAIFFVTNATDMVESFLSGARQYPEVPGKALKFSGQFPASFLEEVVPVGMHSLEMWKNNKIVRPLLVATERLCDHYW